MVWVVVGARTEERMQQLLDSAELLDGIKEIRTYADEPLMALLGFMRKEQARTAQWLIDLSNDEGREEE